MSEETTIDNLNELPDTGGDEWGNYQPPSDFSRPPEPAVYTFMRVTDEDTWKQGIFKNDGVEVAWFNFRATVSGGEHDGRLAFGGCNTMISKFRAGTTVQDFVFSAGAAVRPRSSELVALVKADKQTPLEQIIGPFKARTNWEWRCRDCEETFLRGFKKPRSPKKYTGPKPLVRKEADGKTTSHEQSCPLCQTLVGATFVMTSFVVPKIGSATGPTPRPVVPAPAGMAPSAA